MMSTKPIYNRRLSKCFIIPFAKDLITNVRKLVQTKITISEQILFQPCLLILSLIWVTGQMKPVLGCLPVKILFLY